MSIVGTAAIHVSTVEPVVVRKRLVEPTIARDKET